ncbi:MAG: PDZ domain-containing protein [Sediminibacterium sp.]|nr:PDZ domain-containing protein [Sediminibacterium sp.]
MKRYLPYMLLIWFPVLLNAQNIKRKGTMGVSLQLSISDSLSKALHLTQTEGALVKQVFPGTTASTLKIQANDLITQVNGTAIHSGMDLIRNARALRGGDPISVSVLRGKKTLVLKGEVVGRPFEQHADMNITYSEFAYDNGYIRSIYRTPKNQKPLGTVYFIQGISCYSLDNMGAKDPTRLAIEAMVQKGYAVFCVEKPGMGDNTNTTPCEEAGYNLEVEVFKAGYKHLLTLKDVDPQNIFLFGHSLGGFSAPLIAQDFQPKGVIIYGAGLKPWSEYLIDVFTLQQQKMGEDLATLRENFENLKPSFYEYFYGQSSIDDLLKNQTHRQVLQTVMEYNPDTKTALAGRSLQFHKEINQHNSAMAWKKTKSYVMAIYGEADIAAIHPDDHIAIVDYVNEVHPGKGTYLFVPKTNHTFQETGTMAEYVKMQSNPAEYERMAADRFNYKLFDTVCEWMNDKLTKTL